MSKAKLIELIKASQEDVYDFFAETPTYEVQKILLEALQDQHNDTCRGCALKIHTDRPDEHHPILNLAQCSCLNYQDKDLDGL